MTRIVDFLFFISVICHLLTRNKLLIIIIIIICIKSKAKSKWRKIGQIFGKEGKLPAYSCVAR